MSREIDERIVEMRFDNEHFEKNIQTSMSTLDKFKQKLQFKNAGKSFDDIERSAKNTDLSPLSKSADTVGLRFNAIYTIADQAFRNITNAAMAAGKRIVSALTIDPIKTGLSEYETKMNAVQVIQANTRGKDTMEDITAALEELNVYADKTIYNFAQMTSNVGKFTAQGYRAKEAANAVKGLANLAAASGASAEDMARATYQMSQALGGTIRMIDWNSLRNANMATVDLKNTLMDLARVNGIAIDDMIAKHGTFEQTLQEGWLSGSMFSEAMNIYSGIYSKAELKAKGFTDAQIANFMDLAKMAESAATEVKTFTQLFDVLKETAQSGWTQTWEIIFGDFNTAKKMFTELQVYFGDILNAFSDARNMFIGGAFNLKNPWSKIWEKLEASNIGKMVNTFDKVSSSIENAGDKLEYFQKIVNDVWRGDYKNSDTGRYDLLEAAGYNHNVIQDLVNKGYNYKLTIGDIEESHKKFGVTLGENAESLNASGEAAEVATVKFKEITDEQLKQAGLTKDEIKLYRELAKEAERTNKSLLDVVEEMSENDGRTMLIDSFKNAWSGLVSVFKAARDAWVEIFPPATSIQLYNIIKAIRDFSERLVMSDETAEKLTRTFKGLFAALDIILKVVIAPIKLAFKALVYLLDALDIDILSITASIGDVIVEFNEWIDAIVKWIGSLKNSENLPQDIVNGIVKGFSKAFDTIIGWIRQLGTGLQNGFSGVSDNIVSGLVNGLWNGLKIAGQVIFELGKVLIAKMCEVLGIHSPSKEFAEVGENIILGLMSGIKKTFPIVLNTISECAILLVNAVKRIINEIDLKSVFSGVLTAVASITAIRISNVIENFGSMFKGVGDILDGVAKGVKDVLKSVGNMLEDVGDGVESLLKDTGKGVKSMLKGIGTSFRAKAIKQIAVSLLMLVGAIALLSLIPTDKLITSMAAISVMAVVLGGLFLMVDKVSKKYANKKEAAKLKTLAMSMIGISISLIILAKACTTLGAMSWEGLGKAAVGLIGITGIIAALITMVNSIGITNIAKKIIQLIALTSIVGALAGIVVVLSLINAEKALTSTMALISLMSAMTALMLVLNLIKINIKDAFIGILGLTAMLIPLWAFALSLSALPPMAGKEKEILILVGVMTVMTVLLLATSAVGAIYMATVGVAATGLIGLAAMAGLMWIFSLALSKLKDFSANIPIIETLIGVMTTMTDLLVKVAIVGPLALIGVVALAALSALMVGFGAFATGVGYLVTEFPQLKEFLDTGIPIFEQLAHGLGSVISSFLTGLLSGLPEVGTLLTDFIDNAEGFISGIKMVDGDVLDGIDILVAAFTALVGMDFVTGLKKFFSGGESPFASFGEGLTSLGQYISDFSDSMSGFTDDQLAAVKRGAAALKVIAEAAATIPNSGGLLGLVEGNNDLTDFIAMITGDPDNGIKGVKELVECLSGIEIDYSVSDKVKIVSNIITTIAEAAKTIPNSGGAAGLFTGNNDIDDFIAMIVGDPNNNINGIQELIQCLSDISLKEGIIDDIETISNIIKTLSEASDDIPNTGGWAGAFAGNNDIDGFIAMLVGSENKMGIKDLMDSLSSINLEDTTIDKINKIIDTITEIINAATTIEKNTNKNFGNFGSNLVSFVNNFKIFVDKMTEIKTEVVNSAISKINELVKLCGQFTSDSVTNIANFRKVLSDVASGGIDAFIEKFTSETSINSVTTAINTFLDNIIAKIQVDKNKKKFEKLGKYLMEGLRDGIVNNQSIVTTAAKNAANAAYDAAKNELEVNSPSKKFMELGSGIDEGLAKGIDDNAYLAEDSARDLADGLVDATQDELEINSPSLVFKENVGKYICQGIAEGITEDTSPEDALKIKMDNLYSAYLELKKKWSGESPIPLYYDFVVQNDLHKVSSKNEDNDKVLDDILAQTIEDLENTKKKDESNYKWSKLGSAVGLSDAAENKKNYLNNQINNNNQLLALYEKQIKDYQARTDIQTDGYIADIRAKMVALKEENAEFQSQINNAAAEEAAEAAAEVSEQFQKNLDRIKSDLEFEDAKYENWVVSYPDAKQSVKHTKLFEHLDAELKLLKEQESILKQKVNAIAAAAGTSSEEYRAAYGEWVKARADMFAKEDEISDTHEQHLQELDNADDRVRETEYELWLARNQNASEQVLLAREMQYLKDSLVDAEEESAKFYAEYLKVVEREGDMSAEAVKTALADWNESVKKEVSIRNQINDNVEASVAAAEEASDRLRESTYDLWKSENEDASDREKLTKELAYIEESILDANEDVLKAQEEYNKALVAEDATETEINNRLADLNEAKKTQADLQQQKNDTEESILALVEEEKSIASDIAKLKYDIWEKTEGRKATDAVKEAKQLEYLNQQLLYQNQFTNEAMREYNKVKEEHGPESIEATRAYQAYLNEVYNLAQLKNDILDLEESAADRQKRLKDKQDLASQEYDDYIKQYEKYYTANGMSRADLERDAKLVSGYDPTNVVNNITSKTQTALESVTTSVNYQSILTGFSDMGTSYVQAMGEGATTQMEDFTKKTFDMVVECSKKLTTARTLWSYAGKQLVNGLIQGVNERKSAAINATYQVAVEMLMAAERALKIKSPSREFAEIGKYSILGLVQGLVDNSGLSDSAAAGIGDSAIESLKASISKISDVVNSDLDTQPTIRPVLDLSNIRSGTARLNAMMSATQAMSISDSRKAREYSDGNQNGNDPSTNTGNTYQFTQNNYSPKALPRSEIYRQTKNQFAAMKEVLG